MKPTCISKFREALKAHGAEILAPTNPYELLRFRSSLGVGVIYTGKRGERWNAEALATREHMNARKGSLAPVKVVGRRRDKATVAAVLERDGDGCFFCRKPLGDDITVEHLVPVSHGGPNHISNLFLAHGQCNNDAGHLSAPEKVARAISSSLALVAATGA